MAETTQGGAVSLGEMSLLCVCSHRLPPMGTLTWPLCSFSLCIFQMQERKEAGEDGCSLGLSRPIWDSGLWPGWRPGVVKDTAGKAESQSWGAWGSLHPPFSY